MMNTLMNVISSRIMLLTAVLLACLFVVVLSSTLLAKAMASAVAFFFMHQSVALHLHHHLHHHHHHGHVAVRLATVFASKHAQVNHETPSRAGFMVS